MQKTKVINATGSRITVKMSNNGIITKLRDGDVESGKSYTISIDPNATYREYWCAVPPDTNPQPKAILSSDDCAEFLEVTIIKDDTVDPPVYSWKGTKPRNNKRSIARNPQPAPSSTSTIPAASSTSTVPAPPPPQAGANNHAKSCLIL